MQVRQSCIDHVDFRAHDGVGFELDRVVLGGGTLPTLDILLRPTLVVPLAGRTPYFAQLIASATAGTSAS